MPSLHVESLSEAVEEVIRRGVAGGVAVVAEKLPVRDAVAFDMLMEILAAEDDAWVLGNGDGVKSLVRTSSALLLLERALLPALRWRPTDGQLLRAVAACALKLREVAVDAGGSARREAALLADSISQFVDHAHEAAAPHDVLRDGVDALKDRCSDLLATQCTLMQQ